MTGSKLLLKHLGINHRSESFVVHCFDCSIQLIQLTFLFCSLASLYEDMDLMFENCKEYNRPDSRLYKDGVKLQRIAVSVNYIRSIEICCSTASHLFSLILELKLTEGQIRGTGRLQRWR